MMKLFQALRPGRGTTFFVAASNANPLSKFLADYVCDGISDQVEINAALAALPSAGGSIRLSEGTFTIDGSIATAKAGSRLQGSGVTTTTITAANSAGSNTALINLAHNFCTLESLRIDGNKANNVGRTSMRNFTVTGTLCVVRDIFAVSSAGNAVDVTGGGYGVQLDNILVDSPVAVGFNIASTGAVSGTSLLNCRAILSGSVGFIISGIGHRLLGCVSYASSNHGFSDAGTGTKFEDCSAIANAQFGWLLNGNKSAIQGGFAISNGWGIIVISTTGTNHIEGVQVTDNATGIQLDTNSLSTSIVGCSVRNNSTFGIYTNTSNCSVLGNHISENSTGAASTYAGILCGASAHNNYFDGNKIWRGASGNRQSYGIYIDTGATNNYIGHNDLFESGMTGEILDLGTNTRRAVKLQLDYVASTDLHNASAISANTWTDVGTNQTFRVDSTTSVVEIAYMGSMQLGNSGAAGTVMSARLVIDSAGTPINKKIGGEITEVSTQFQNPLSGSQPIKLSGLAIGNHTVKLQVRSSAATVLYLRASSVPETEHLNIQVTEYQR